MVELVVGMELIIKSLSPLETYEIFKTFVPDPPFILSVQLPDLLAILKVSSPAQPIKVSLPAPPLKVSSPAPPIRISSPEVPLIVWLEVVED